MSERDPYQDKRDWIMVALIGGDISSRSAAARLSAVDKAERDNLPCPDIRTWSYDAIAERVTDGSYYGQQAV